MYSIYMSVMDRRDFTKVIGVGAVGLVASFLPGCSNDNVIRIFGPQVDYKGIADNVFYIVDGFSRAIPTGFERTTDASLGSDSYYDSSFKLKKGSKPTIENLSGVGRFVTKNPKILNAGYMNTEEVKEFKRTGDPRHLDDTMIFAKYLTLGRDSHGIVEDGFSLMRGNNAVIYMKVDGAWRKRNIEVGEGNNVEMGRADKIKNLPKINPTHVKRYLDLADRLKQTYFSK